MATSPDQQPPAAPDLTHAEATLAMLSATLRREQYSLHRHVQMRRTFARQETLGRRRIRGLQLRIQAELARYPALYKRVGLEEPDSD